MPTKEQEADAPSRILNNNDCRLRDEIKIIVTTLMNVTVDCFASLENRVVSKYLSLDYHATALPDDAFSHSYPSDEIYYAFPPTPVLHRFVKLLDSFPDIQIVVVSQEYQLRTMNLHIMDRHFDYYFKIGSRKYPATMCPARHRNEDGLYFRPYHGPHKTYLHFKNVSYTIVREIYNAYFSYNHLANIHSNTTDLLRKWFMRWRRAAQIRPSGILPEF